MKRIAYSKAAFRALARMPANTSKLIRSKIEQYAADPASLANNVKSLKGEPGYLRLRVGDWRVLLSEDESEIAVIRIAPRGSVYECETDRQAEATMGAQIIIAPDGARLVVIPESEYRALSEAAVDAADREAVRRFRGELAARDEELIPAEVVNRILDGENPVRVWRKHRGMTLKELAKRAGIGPAYLSQVETGKRDGTVVTLRSIAEQLGVALDDLVPPDTT